MIEKRKLGRTSVDVSVLTFGCGAVGGLMVKGDAAEQERAAALAPYAVFDNAGQDCCARSRILVQRSVLDRFMELFEKAAKGPVDVIFLDLEDAVAPDAKDQARKNVIQALNEVDWRGKTMSLRINGLDTHWMYRDVIDVLEGAVDKLDLIMIPKAGTAADIYALDMLVTQIETATKARKRIGFEMIIETALGMANVEAIPAASKRNESLHFGVADYAASTKAKTVNIGGPHPQRDRFVAKQEFGFQEVSSWTPPRPGSASADSKPNLPIVNLDYFVETVGFVTIIRRVRSGANAIKN